MSEQAVDPKLVGRIHKLLRLARDGGATEGEANNAMEMAQRIMLENNLSMATIEEAGEVATDGKRIKEAVAGSSYGGGKTRSLAMYEWQRELMRAIAEVNFCVAIVKEGYRGRTWRPVGYQLIGRESNVVATCEMFAYLITTINRLLLDHNGGDAKQNMSKYSNSWKEGCADRLQQRLKERHEAMLAEQAREARERSATSRHPSAAPTGTALAIVIEDYAQKEADLNRDIRHGWEPGTTERQRLADEQAERENQEARRQALIEAQDQGATERELTAMRNYGYSLERARHFLWQIDNPEPDTRTEAQKARDEERERKQQERWERQDERERQKARNRLDQRGYRAGREAGDKIGLDKQVTSDDKRRLS